MRILNDLTAADWHYCSISAAAVATHLEILCVNLVRIVNVLDCLALLIDLSPLLLGGLCGEWDALGVAALNLVATPLIHCFAVAHGAHSNPNEPQGIV